MQNAITITNSAEFLAHYASADLDVKVAALKSARDFGWGTWMTPECATSSARPATHQHEITMFDVMATGVTEANAAANWFKIAARVLTPQVAA